MTEPTESKSLRTPPVGGNTCGFSYISPCARSLDLTTVTLMLLLIDGFEPVSRVMNTTMKEPKWQAEVDLVWDTIKETFYIGVDPFCGTHIHCRPVSAFTLNELNSVAKIIGLYEAEVRNSLPVERRD